MKKLLLSAAILVVVSSAANAWTDGRGHWFEGPIPPPLGWVYGRYVDCGPHGCVVSVMADGANVRYDPNGPVFLSLTNGVPVVIVQWRGPWVLVTLECNLVPTGLWSDTAGVPLDTCGWEPVNLPPPVYNSHGEVHSQQAYPPPHPRVRPRSTEKQLPPRARIEPSPPVVPPQHEPPGVPLEGGPEVPLTPSVPSNPPRPYQQN
jgi:hypothetical protein